MTEDQSPEEGFELLLEHLSTDPVEAERFYRRLRMRLIRLFQGRRCRFPEDLADETLMRVAEKLGQGLEIRTDDPFQYCCGVAFNVFQEVLRQDRRQREAAQSGDIQRVFHEQTPDEPDARMDCLNRCLAEMLVKSRQLVLGYYRGDGSARIEGRRKLAAELGLAMNALRIRACRLRSGLQGCVSDCMREGSGA